MTTPPPPLTDEDVSAVLDGQADEATRARVLADPGARARIDAFHQVSQQIRNTAPVPLEPSVVDQLIGRALAAEAAPSPVEDREAAVITPLPTSRGSRLGSPRWLVAAAVVVLAAVGLALVWSGTQQGGDDVTATATLSTDRPIDGSASDTDPSRTAEGSEDGGAESSVDAEFAPSEAPATSPATPGPVLGGVPVGQLGSFDDPDALRTAVKDQFPEDAATTTNSDRPSAAAIERCVTQSKQIFGLDGQPSGVALATVDGVTVVVLEFPATSVRDGGPTTFVTADEIETCNPILSFERDPG